MAEGGHIEVAGTSEQLSLSERVASFSDAHIKLLLDRLKETSLEFPPVLVHAFSANDGIKILEEAQKRGIINAQEAKRRAAFFILQMYVAGLKIDPRLLESFR